MVVLALVLSLSVLAGPALSASRCRCTTNSGDRPDQSAVRCKLSQPNSELVYGSPLQLRVETTQKCPVLSVVGTKGEAKGFVTSDYLQKNMLLKIIPLPG